jgi:hypothetical protein
MNHETETETEAERTNAGPIASVLSRLPGIVHGWLGYGGLR